MFTLNGVACQAVVDPVGQADEEEGGAHGHLGHDIKDWDNVQGDVQMRRDFSKRYSVCSLVWPRTEEQITGNIALLVKAH